MDKREFSRKKKRILLQLNGKPAILLDISRKGIKLSTTSAPASRQVDITINYHDQLIQLKGYVRWIRKTLVMQNTRDIGLSITSAPSEFYQFLETI